MELTKTIVNTSKMLSEIIQGSFDNLIENSMPIVDKSTRQKRKQQEASDRIFRLRLENRNLENKNK